jgi:hypothetical protein
VASFTGTARHAVLWVASICTWLRRRAVDVPPRFAHDPVTVRQHLPVQMGLHLVCWGAETHPLAGQRQLASCVTLRDASLDVRPPTDVCEHGVRNNDCRPRVGISVARTTATREREVVGGFHFHEALVLSSNPIQI